MHRYMMLMHRFILDRFWKNEKNPIISKTVSIITFEPFIGIGRSLYGTEGKNMLYHLVMRDFIFTRLLPDFSDLIERDYFDGL